MDTAYKLSVGKCPVKDDNCQAVRAVINVCVLRFKCTHDTIGEVVENKMLVRPARNRGAEQIVGLVTKPRCETAENPGQNTNMCRSGR